MNITPVNNNTNYKLQKKQTTSFGSIAFIKANKIAVVVPDNSSFVVRQAKLFLKSLGKNIVEIMTPEKKKIKLRTNEDIDHVSTRIQYAIKQDKGSIRDTEIKL